MYLAILYIFIDDTKKGGDCLLVGVYTPDGGPAQAVQVHHVGQGRYQIGYKVGPTNAAEAVVVAKFGDIHVPGSPFHVSLVGGKQKS
jgi:hypothetical protein